MTKLSTGLALAFALAWLACGCSSGPDVVFVREDLDLDGEPRQILKVMEPVKAPVAYFDGAEWIITRATIPAGWLVVSPALAETENDK